uniref:Uncharacterized protein n=1 Tax=Glossina pallidipes TaxID=7398 RepID=A0A1B0AJG0_GLOPL
MDEAAKEVQSTKCVQDSHTLLSFRLYDNLYQFPICTVQSMHIDIFRTESFVLPKDQFHPTILLSLKRLLLGDVKASSVAVSIKRTTEYSKSRALSQTNDVLASCLLFYLVCAEVTIATTCCVYSTLAKEKKSKKKRNLEA